MSALPESFYHAATVDEALNLLAAGAAPLAGGTWTMRAPLREEALPAVSVAIGRIADLRRVDIGERDIAIGACATHVEIAAALAGVPECRGLVQAALGAANPAIREVATIGGNLCTLAFAAQDFIPALLALDAQVEVRSAAGTALLPLLGALARLPLRKAGDYPVAIVSMAAALDAGGHAGEIRIAVGSVEPVARRWSTLEAALSGRLLDPEKAAEIAGDHVSFFTGRDGVEAPGWYRVQVLPALVRRAVASLLDGRH